MSPMNRRDVLKGTATAILAALMTQGLDWAAAPSASAALAGPATTGRQSLLGTAAAAADPAPIGPAAAFLAPYTAAATSALSEDYFLTNEIILGAGDRVLPFQRPDGTVEALVVNPTAGTITYLQSDPTSSSGWTYSTVPTDEITNGPLTDCAVQLGSDGTVYCIFTQYNLYGQNNLLVYWMSLAPDTSSGWNIANGSSAPEYFINAPGPLKSNVDLNGQAFIYAVNTDGTANLWQAQANYGYPSIEVTGLPTDTFSDATMVWNFNWNDSTPASQKGLIVLALNGQAAPLLYQNGATSVEQGFAADPFVLIPWVGWPEGAGQPGFLAQDVSGLFWYVWGGIAYQVATTPGQAGEAATWFSDGLLSTVLLIDDTATVVTQYVQGPPGDFAFTDGIPISGGLVALTGSAVNPAAATLFVTDAADVLQVLSKDPVTGIWTQTAVSADTLSTQPVTTWRTEIELTDSNGLPLSGCPVTITPSQTTGFWRPEGAIIAGPDTPFSTTADGHGRVTLAIIACEIDAPMLSVQVYSGNAPSGPPVVVNPAQNLHDFFAGTGSIGGVGTLTPTDASCLLSAQTPAGAPLFPVLSKITDPTQQTQAANAVGNAINQAMIAAAGPPRNGVNSFTLDFTSGTPTYTPSTPTGQLGALGSIGSWFDRAVHDIESVFHGIRHGLITVEKCTATFVSAAAGWAVSLAVTIGTDISDTVTYAITDIRSAIHAVSGFFNSLGADIEDVIAWLRTNIVETFKSAAANAHTMTTWLGNLGSQLGNGLNTISDLETAYFTSRAAAVNTLLTNTLIPGTATWTLGDYAATASTATAPTGTRSTASTSAAGTVADIALDVVTVWHDVSGNWLLNKLESEFESLLQTPGGSDPIATAINKLIDDITGTAWLTDIGNTLWTTFQQNSTKDVDNVKEMAFEVILDALEALIDGTMEFIETALADMINLAQAILAEWNAMLETNLLQLPLISALLNFLGIDLQLEVGHIFAFIMMFPTTIAYRIKFGGTGTMFTTAATTTASDSGRAAASATTATTDQLAIDLNFAHAAIRGGNALVDALVDYSVYSDSSSDDASQKKSPLSYIGYLNTIAKSLINVATYPGQKNADGTVAPPFVNPPIDPTTSSLDAQIFSGFLISWIIPLLAGGTQIANATGVSKSYSAWAPYIRSLVGVGSFGLGIATNVEKNSIKELTAAAALEHVPSMVSPLAVAQINDETFFIPLAVKLFIDVVLEPIAADLLVAYGP